MEKRLWFKAKQFGWGWTPCTWQGWGILGLYLLGITPIFITSPRTNSLQDFLELFPQVFILTLFLIIICYLTGEKPRWRWGK
jgi:hypothetical protein